MLAAGLGRRVRLPREPQTVPTFAPNVYVLFVSGDEAAVVAHLAAPDPGAVPYDWRGGTFHAYTLAFRFEPDRAGG